MIDFFKLQKVIKTSLSKKYIVRGIVQNEYHTMFKQIPKQERE